MSLFTPEIEQMYLAMQMQVEQLRKEADEMLEMLLNTEHTAKEKDLIRRGIDFAITQADNLEAAAYTSIELKKYQVTKNASTNHTLH